MAQSICIACQKLLYYPAKDAHKKKECECGCKEFKRLSGTLSEDGTRWIYTDRAGNYVTEVEIKIPQSI